MAIFQITSTNPSFSKIIRKHPKGDMRATSLRLGNAFGWYSQNDTAYNIYFRDAEGEVSFQEFEEQVFEYLNASRYNSSLFPSHATKEFFASARKDKVEEDTADFSNTAFINCIRIKRSNLIEKVKEHFKKFDIELIQAEEVSKDFSIRVTTDQSLYELLNFIDLFCLFIAATNREYFYTDSSLLQKYLSSLEVIDAPYFFRYVFKIHFLWKQKEFEEFKSLLESSQQYKIKMTFGNNLQTRKRFVDQHIDLEKSIFDVGCGEGYYTLDYAKKSENTIHAVDIDQEILEELKARAEKRALKNIATYTSAHDLPENLSPQVVLSEVIEHMDINAATQLLLDIADKKPEKIIISTPNKDFNQFYFENEETMRHDDHNFELTKIEFTGWIIDVIKKLKKSHEKIESIESEIFDIGDIVNGHATTLGCVLLFQYK